MLPLMMAQGLFQVNNLIQFVNILFSDSLFQVLDCCCTLISIQFENVVNRNIFSPSPPSLCSVCIGIWPSGVHVGSAPREGDQRGAGQRLGRLRHRSLGVRRHAQLHRFRAFVWSHASVSVWWSSDDDRLIRITGSDENTFFWLLIFQKLLTELFRFDFYAASFGFATMKSSKLFTDSQPYAQFGGRGGRGRGRGFVPISSIKKLI